MKARHWCPSCTEEVGDEPLCEDCGSCADCCDCDDVVASGMFDADEFGEEPEDEWERRTRG